MAITITGTGPSTLRSFAFPDAAATILTSLSAPLASTGTLSVAATQGGRGPLHIGMGSSTDPVLAFGYNHKADFTVATASEPGLAWMLEANYDDGSGQNKMEGYLQYLYPDGSGKYNRTFMMQFNRVTNLPVETALSAGTRGVRLYNNTGAGALGSELFTLGTWIGRFGPTTSSSLLPFGIGRDVPATALHVEEASLWGVAVQDTVTISQVNSGGNTANPSSFGAIAWKNGSTVYARTQAVWDNPAGNAGVHLEFWATTSAGVLAEKLRIRANGDVAITGGGDLQWGKALVALGGGAAPTLGTIGGSGPATAAQNTWLRVLDSTGAACWVPAWK